MTKIGYWNYVPPRPEDEEDDEEAAVVPPKMNYKRRCFGFNRCWQQSERENIKLKVLKGSFLGHTAPSFGKSSMLPISSSRSSPGSQCLMVKSWTAGNGRTWCRRCRKRTTLSTSRPAFAGHCYCYCYCYCYAGRGLPNLPVGKLSQVVIVVVSLVLVLSLSLLLLLLLPEEAYPLGSSLVWP